ncbi:unnamed protein product [Cylicocyclus nassatus]|uniref:BPTI/Kunitz inhibitor domain-containing protein n=1 Tax=Cylicocyclus nassatus TaxID=53992 RepID=A0AA36M6G3_CYLNA|nr:unnamed protein product [Cylicocyclus nassatus]
MQMSGAATGCENQRRNGECPTNGQNSLLYNRDTNTPSTCTILNSDSWEFIGCDDFPEVYNCIDGLCCPTKALTCIQPLNYGNQGSSSSPTSRWYYDSITSSCQTFPFSGAGGNSNNFPTKGLCESYCLTEYICSLPMQSGRKCGQNVALRWYFDEATNLCRSFHFEGCDGNINNFPTKESCEELCPKLGTFCPFGGDYHRSADGYPLACGKSEQCPSRYECVALTHAEGSTNFCCPSRLSICSQSKDEGSACGQPSRRYYFDANTQHCKPMMFLGCGGNSNRFSTADACRNFCASSGVCPDGLQQLSDPRTLLPSPCRGNRHDACPHSFHCLLHPLKKRHFCCGPKKQNDLCPIGSRLIRLGSGDPMGCNAHARCPIGADCHGSSSAHSGICCKNLLNGAENSVIFPVF